MSYQPRSTNPYIMEKKLNECVGGGGGGFDPSVLEEIEAEISVLGSENATMAQDIIDIKGSLNSINDNLSGFKFYPTGTGIVGLIADDSAYTDANGKYVVWGTATANQLVADNPNTYKSVPSTEDTRGEVGADTGVPFSKKEEPVLIGNFSIRANQSGSQFNLTDAISNYKYIAFKFALGINGSGVDQFNNITTSDKTKLTDFYDASNLIRQAKTDGFTSLYFFYYYSSGTQCTVTITKMSDTQLKLEAGGTGFYVTVWGIK